MNDAHLINKYDRILRIAFYLNIYFLPISSAITESMFGVFFLTFLVKRIHLLVLSQKGLPSQSESWMKKIYLFFKAFKPVDGFLNKPVTVYALCIFLTIFFSRYPLMSLNAFFFKFWQTVFTYFIFIECFKTRKHLWIFLTVLLVSNTLVITNGLYQYFFHKDFIFGQPITDARVTSCFKHANDLSAYLISFLPIWLCLSYFYSIEGHGLARGRRCSTWPWFHATAKWRSEGSSLDTLKKTELVTNRWIDLGVMRWWRTILFVLGLLCLGLTLSRSGWMAFVVCLLWFVVYRPRLLFLLSIFIVIFFVIFFPIIKENRKLAFSPEPASSTSQRIVYWREASELISESPIVGVGLNTYSLAGIKFHMVNGWGGYPHNCYLQTAAETGIPSLLLFLWILFSLFRRIIANLKRTAERFLDRALLGLSIGFSAYLFQSFFDTNFYSVRLGSLMWILIGLLVFMVRLAEENNSQKVQ